MFNLKSIFSLLALGSVMVDNPLPQRIISKLLWVIALVVVSSILVGALLLAAIICGYEQLVAHGIPQLDAALYMIAGLLALAGTAIVSTNCYVKKLLNDVRANFKRPMPLTSHLTSQAGSIFDSFVDGFMNRNKNQK